MRKFVAVALFTCTLFSRRSEALLDLSIVGALNFSSPSIQTAGTPQTTATTGVFGFGALAAFPIFPGFNLESGVLYLGHSYTSAGFQNTLGGIQIPALVRFTGFPILSIAAGPYLSFPTGRLTRRNVSNGTETNTELSSAGINSTDIGIALSAATDIPLTDTIIFVADLRYYFGIKSVDANPVNSFKYGGLLVLGGFKIGL